jgi:hypothetical protein
MVILYLCSAGLLHEKFQKVPQVSLLVDIIMNAKLHRIFLLELTIWKLILTFSKNLQADSNL